MIILHDDLGYQVQMTHEEYNAITGALMTVMAEVELDVQEWSKLRTILDEFTAAVA